MVFSMKNYYYYYLPNESYVNIFRDLLETVKKMASFSAKDEVSFEMCRSRYDISKLLLMEVK